MSLNNNTLGSKQKKINFPMMDFYHTSIDYLLYQTDQRTPYPKSIMSKK